MSRLRQKDNLIGESDAFLEVLEQVSGIAPLDKPVLIIGERGTGKELIAARLHYLSPRWEQNYVKLNCAALSETLLESELFGHESGAFTGANKRHEGRFERAHHGSLFLDELANTSSLVQEKLLRVIEYGELERVGGKQTIKVDTRLICATNEDLPTLAEEGQFRSDLLDRLAFDVITLPPLRYRQEDILILAEYFAIQMARELGWSLFSGFTTRAKEVLLSYHWPGNIRELKNVVERSVYRSADPNIPVSQVILDPFHSPFRPSVRSSETQHRHPGNEPEGASSVAINRESEPTYSFPLNLKEACQSYEISVIQQALAAHHYSQKKTAQALSLSYHQFRGILKKYNLLDEIKK
ncbi:phage shock protein operon transcriptional activator [Algicola sagamiensis]|uniref:phage shock protein operon transcriptional activator n=1 Tax=Algicola sagamiensis TaxID=163869 RepID=UPI00035D08E2|nr:phage shock protein operon transcriptional activator [Algicola sagamiensis]